jgi:hypothetical protein
MSRNDQATMRAVNMYTKRSLVIVGLGDCWHCFADFDKG